MSFRVVFDPRLNNVNTTNYRIVVVVRMSVLVIAVAMATFVWEVLHEHHAMSIDILDSLLTAIVVLSGINAAQYGLKRFSDSGYKAAGQPAQVTTTEGGPITVATGGAVQQSVDEKPAERPPEQPRA